MSGLAEELHAQSEDDRRFAPSSAEPMAGDDSDEEERTVSWSTRELAELAGTTVRAVRHYHEVGLLEEPERGANGYKRYDAAHLVRLRRIKHLRDLGFSLVEVCAMGEHDPSPQALCALDRELALTVERLQRARSELGSILRHSVALEPEPERSTGGGVQRPREPATQIPVQRLRVLCARTDDERRHGELRRSGGGPRRETAGDRQLCRRRDDAC